MIAVRIPDEIKKYKEKIVWGLTARQVIALLLAAFICVPLYWYGRDFIPEDVLSWIIILIAVPIGAIGFFRFNGMPMEKYAIAIFKFEFLYPRKRVFKTENAFREWQNEADKEDKTLNPFDDFKRNELDELASLERAYLMEIGENENREIDLEKEALLRNDEHNRNGKKQKKEKKRREEKNMKNSLFSSKVKEQAEKIQQKQKEDPSYVPSKKEYLILKKWNNEQLKAKKKAVIEKTKGVAEKSNNMKKRRKVKTAIPKSTQQTIPYVADYEEGLFEVSPNKYSKMYRIKDINYRTAKDDDQINIFCKLGEFLNYFSEEMRFAFVIDNRVISTEEQERKVFYPMTGDEYDRHRKEYNNILKRQIVAGKNDIQVQKFLTVTIDSNTPIEALLRFHKIDAEIITNFKKIGSDATVLSTDERLEYYHDKFRKGREGDFNIDYDFIKTQGISSKDYIAPSFIHFDRKHFQIEDEYYRCLFLNNLPASLQDEFLSEICDNDFPVTTSLSIQPVAQDKGLKIVKKQLTGIEKDKIEAEKRAIRAGYSPETIQHSIKDALAGAEALYDDMMNKNQKMFFVTITMMVHGSTLDELEENCNIVISKARKYTSQLQVLTSQQEEAFKVTLPFGYVPKDLCVERTLTTESTSIFMPFSNQELFQPGGFYYGLNQISHNLVVVNRTQMKTPSGFVLGSSGSGKSFATKREILNVLLNDSRTGILIIDPENEYADFCRAFGGVVLKISADSDNHINPMDMPREYGLDEDDDVNTTPLSVMKDKALKKKSDYIMSIVERMISVGSSGDNTSITPQQRTIVDRCVVRTYAKYLEHDFNEAYLPTLIDLQNELDQERGSEEGRQVAEGIEYYTKGSMDIFAHHTNVAVENRLVVFNVRDLGEQLKQIALIIVFDFIWNRMIENKNKGIRTYCYCDEIHVMFQSYYAANFLKQLYKRGRKYGLCITGITQNVEELLRSEQARGMISNSDFIMMLNQSSEDLKILAGMLNISETQMGFVTGAEAGEGLLFAEKVIVPFVDRFPEESYLYKLMSTKFGDDLTKEEINKIIKEIMTENKVEVPMTEKQIENRVQEIYQAV